MNKNKKFDVVTPDWIRSQQEQKRVSNKLLAAEVNVEPSKISQWLSGNNMSGSARAAIYWYFKQV
jgi:transcriptional regulator with XRE-family HTH domain